MIFLQIWWTVLFLSGGSHEELQTHEVSPQLRKFSEDFFKLRGEMRELRSAYNNYHSSQLLRDRRDSLSELLAGFQEEDRHALKTAADAWYQQFLKLPVTISKTSVRRRTNVDCTAKDSTNLSRKSPVKKYIKDFRKEMEKTEMAKIKKKYEGQSAKMILMTSPENQKKSMPTSSNLFSLRGSPLANSVEADLDDDLENERQQVDDVVSDSAYKEARSRLDQMYPSEAAQVTRNNLSHEAEYKLSRLEQEAAEASRQHVRWNVRHGGLKRSSDFNPMNEIKLKTSRRLMNRGFGPSLPSNSITDSQRFMQMNEMMRRKDQQLENEQTQKGDQMKTRAFMSDVPRFSDSGTFEYSLPAYDDMKSMKLTDVTDYPKRQPDAETGEQYGDADYSGMRAKRLSKGEENKSNNNGEEVVKNAVLQKSQRQEEANAAEKHEDDAKLSAKDNKLSESNANEINANEINTNEINSNDIVKLDGEQKTKLSNDVAAVAESETKTEEEVKAVNEVKLDNEPKAESSNGNAETNIKTEDETKLEVNANGENGEVKAQGSAIAATTNSVVEHAAVKVKSDPVKIVNLLAKVLPTHVDADNKERPKRNTAKHDGLHQRPFKLHFNLSRIPMARRKRFVLSDVERFQNSRDFDTFERNEDEQRTVRLRRSVALPTEKLTSAVNHTIAKRMTRLLDEMEDHNGNKHKFSGLGNGVLTRDDENYELAKAVSDARDNKELNFGNFMNVFSIDHLKSKSKLAQNNTKKIVQANSQVNENDKNALSFQNYLNSLTIKNDKMLGANVNTNKYLPNNNAPAGMTYSIAIIGQDNQNQTRPNTLVAANQQQHQQPLQQQQPHQYHQVQQQAYPDCITSQNTHFSQPANAVGYGNSLHIAEPTKLNIRINANVRGDAKTKCFLGNGSINVQPGIREERVTRAVWNPFSVWQGHDDKNARLAEPNLLSRKYQKLEKASDDYFSEDLDLDLDAVEDAYEDVDMDMATESRRRRTKHNKKKKSKQQKVKKPKEKPTEKPKEKPQEEQTTTTPEPTEVDLTCDTTQDVKVTYEKLMSGQVATELVKNVIDSAEKDPQLRSIYLDLKHNSCCLQKLKELEAKCPLNMHKHTKDTIKLTEDLVGRFSADLRKIIADSSDKRGCIPLTPSLKNFYELILKSHEIQGNKARLKREYMADEFSKEMRNIDANKIEHESRIVKKLLRQYDELPHGDQLAAQSMRDQLYRNLIQLRHMMDDMPRSRRMSKITDLVKKTRSSDDALKEYQGEFSNRFLKLLKVAEIFKEPQIKEEDAGGKLKPHKLK